MLTFFRKIRHSLLKHGSNRKYLFYAIGEIFLVVIGILIALQINNWNERQKQIKQLKSYAKSLSSDLKRDIEMVHLNIWLAKRNVMLIDSLTRYAKDKSLDQMSNLELWLLTDPIGFRPYQWHRASLDELKSSGTLRALKSDSLRKMIGEYEAFSLHMDEDYIEDREYEGKAIDLRNEIVDRHYSFHRDSIELFNWSKDSLTQSNTLREINKFTFTSEPDFVINWQDYKTQPHYLMGMAEDRKIITSQVSKIRTLVNSMQVYRANMAIRYQGELPRLIDDARAIILQLEELEGKPMPSN